MENIVFSLLMTDFDGAWNSSSPVTSINVRTDKLFSASMIDQLEALPYKGIWIVVIIFMVLSLVVSLKGYKHNQTMFYLQTISFFCYYLGDAKFQTAQYLFNTRVSYLRFSSGPFFNLIPDYYF